MGECLYISFSASFILRFNIQCIFIFISIVIHVHICECWNKIIELKIEYINIDWIDYSEYTHKYTYVS